MAGIRYRKAVATGAALAFVAVFLTLVLTHVGRAKPRPVPHPGIVTAADRYGIAPGTYFTSINIHNPSLTDTLTIYKLAVLAPPESPTVILAVLDPATIQTYSLGPGNAVEVDCDDIEYLLTGTAGVPTSFIEGYVSVFAVGPLDVKGVYSSYLAGGGLTLDTMTITPRIEFVGPGTPAAVAMPARVIEYSAKFLCGPNSLL
jgi:hypothetical protein